MRLLNKSRLAEKFRMMDKRAVEGIGVAADLSSNRCKVIGPMLGDLLMVSSYTQMVFICLLITSPKGQKLFLFSCRQRGTNAV